MPGSITSRCRDLDSRYHQGRGRAHDEGNGPDPAEDGEAEPISSTSVWSRPFSSATTRSSPISRDRSRPTKTSPASPTKTSAIRVITTQGAGTVSNHDDDQDDRGHENEARVR